MSRHEIEPFAKRFEVTVGWDRPMNTFFAQVEDRELTDEDSDPVIVWVGTSHSEILQPEALQHHIARFVTIPQEIIDTLHADRSATMDRRDSTLQQAMKILTGRGLSSRKE
jgi:hypothetical protein